MSNVRLVFLRLLGSDRFLFLNLGDIALLRSFLFSRNGRNLLLLFFYLRFFRELPLFGFILFCRDRGLLLPGLFLLCVFGNFLLRMAVSRVLLTWK